MPAGDEEKVEEATPKRREEFRERGQVVKSPDLVAALMLLFGTLILYIFGGYLFNGLLKCGQMIFSNLGNLHLTVENLPRYAVESVVWLLTLLSPFLIGLVVVAIGANLLQAGVIFSATPITPDIERINPVAGFQRLFSIRAFVHLLMNIFKVSIVFGLVYYTLADQAPQILALMEGETRQIFMFTSACFFNLTFRVSLALLILALIDFGFQFWQHEQEMRMTKQELKEEFRSMEGDPMVRARRRSIHRQLAMQRMLSAVPKADVVITNPTHVAVALQYDHSSDRAPVVVAKGKGFVAEKIRNLAMENGVFLYPDPPLARSLHDAVEVGQEIPADFYKAVAEILAFVFRAQNKENRVMQRSSV
jgi:flagellar biosynthetic protein FlhB